MFELIFIAASICALVRIQFDKTGPGTSPLI
ncbi:hypothetical protein GGQ61_003669 [Phenylobacterium haematophilum]|uniref:Uncharacterized protein n=1 Tax=Phenylobacterium haematophilum TaxID=98513 RepID=A0A840A630_9CAUL|nr:hypothetical protein [Phenylobacterium haematophilum]